MTPTSAISRITPGGKRHPSTCGSGPLVPWSAVPEPATASYGLIHQSEEGSPRTHRSGLTGPG